MRREDFGKSRRAYRQYRLNSSAIRSVGEVEDRDAEATEHAGGGVMALAWSEKLR